MWCRLVKWRQLDSYRDLIGEYHDYMAYIKGGGRHVFEYSVFYKNEEVASSNEIGSTKDIPQAQRICEMAIFVHSNVKQ